MKAKPTFIATRTNTLSRHILRDLYLTGYKNVRAWWHGSVTVVVSGTATNGGMEMHCSP